MTDLEIVAIILVVFILFLIYLFFYYVNYRDDKEELKMNKFNELLRAHYDAVISERAYITTLDIRLYRIEEKLK